MKYIHVYLFIGVALLGMSCQKETSKGEYALRSSSRYTLGIDTLTSANQVELFYYNSKQVEFLYLLNTIKNVLQQYDYKTQKVVNTVLLEKEGPNGVGVVNAMYVQSPDSIFILSTYTYRLILINQKGQILRRYPLLVNGAKLNGYGIAEGENAILPVGDNRNLMAKDGDFLYIGAYPVLDPDRLEYFSKGKSGMKINILTGKVEYLINYPESYQKLYQEGWRFPGQYVWSSQTFNANQSLCVFSFPADANVYALDVRSNRLSTYDTKSDYFDAIKLHQIARPSADQNFIHCINNHQYERIFYDPFRNIYLRYCLHPNEHYEEGTNAPMLVSIILINDKFKKIGETLLDEGLGAGYVFFKPDGIYIKSQSDDEDHITFTRFELVKNEN